jgi:hypothetical protein
MQVIFCGWPVAVRTLAHIQPSGSIFFRLETASEIGTCVYLFIQVPTTMFVLPVIAACTAFWPRRRENAASEAFAGTLLII